MCVVLNRIIRASKLDKNLYEEAKSDRQATTQALAIVVLSSLAVGLGSFESLQLVTVVTVSGSVAAFLGWFGWAFITYLIGTKVVRRRQTRCSPVEWFRTVGFSTSPGLIKVIGILPIFEPGLMGLVYILIWLVAFIWMAVATVVSVKEALDLDSSKWKTAMFVSITGWLVHLLIICGIFYAVGPLLPYNFAVILNAVFVSYLIGGPVLVTVFF